MDRRVLRSVLAAMMIAVMLMTAVPAALASTAEFSNEQAAQRIAIASDDYGDPSATAEDILGGLDPDWPMTHASCAEMLYRGFGQLPEPTGFYDVTGYRDAAFTDVSEELAVYVDNLTHAMIYIPEDDTLFEPNAAMSAEALELLIDRIYAYLGSNVKDDFFAAVNHDRLTAALDESYDPRGSWATRYEDETEPFFDWVRELLEHSTDSDEPYMQNIAAYYSTYMSREARDKGVAQFKGYLDAIMEAEDPEALLSVLNRIGVETGIPLLLQYSDFYNDDVTQDGQYALLIQAQAFPTSGAEDYLPGGVSYDDALRYCTTQALMLTGYTEEESAAMVEGDLRNTGRMAAMLAQGSDEASQACALAETFDLTAYLNLCGIPIEASQYTIDRTYLNTCLTLLSSSDTFPDFRQACAVTFLEEFKTSLSLGILDWMAGFWVPIYDAEPNYLLYSANLNAYLFPAVDRDISEAFMNTINIQDDVAKLQAVFEQCKAEFAAMIRQEAWLSEPTQTAALQKLDAMKIHIGIGDETLTQVRAQYASAEQGGTQFSNDCLYRRAANANYCLSIGKDAHELSACVDRMSPLSDNCYYYCECNGVLISLPYLYKNWVCAENTAQYYANTWILGHEIVHGFDVVGSTYDKNGMQVDWWAAEDRQRFEALSRQVADFYSQTEYAPGLTCDGAVSVGESMADMGGLQIVLAVASRLDSFDMDQFFRDLAQMLVTLSSRSGFTEYLYPDEHTVNQARCNTLLSLTEQFYETYGITENDGMYVPPEERIRVW